MANNCVDSLNIDSMDSLKNSRILEESKESWTMVGQWIEKYTEIQFDGRHLLLALMLVVFLLVVLRVLWFACKCFTRKGWKSRSMRNAFFIRLVFACFCSGLLVYFVGYDYAGTSKNVITLLVRSALSSFEMFLSKSNLIGIAENCKNDPVYMMLFAITHALAVILSTSFAVACFWKRIKNWCKSILWMKMGCDTTYVFWGLNERSYMLSRDLYEKAGHKDRIVFVDFPDDKAENNKSQSFSSLIGLLSFKLKLIRQISDINYILFRSSVRPSEFTGGGCDFFDELDLMKLHRILKKSKCGHHFIFTDNESSNLRAAVNMLETGLFNENATIYCAVRKTRLTRLIEEKYIGKLKIIDDSRMAVNSLKNGEIEQSYPIDYVTVNTEESVVESKFTALIIGFGTTGQDALRFLYEFSAFPNTDGKKSKVKIHVVDNKMDQLKGEFLQEVPVLETLAGENNEIELHHMDIGSKEYFELQRSVVKELNYAIIATGDDTSNIETASRLLEMANQYKDNIQRQFRVFVRLYQEANKDKFDAAIEVYKPYSLPLAYFGSAKSLYTKSIIVNDKLRADAEEFHKSYCEANNEEEYVPLEKRLEKECRNTKVGPLYAYRSLERKENQNEANSMHIYTKIKLMGLTENPNTIVLPKWDKKNGLSKSPIDKACVMRLLNASICEHLRWNASHLMMGYLPMTDEVRKQTCGTCNIRVKQHSCIKDWEELDTETQSYDYYVVRTSIYQYLKGISNVRLD